MKARIKSNGKIVEVISRFMPRKRNAASRDWVCNLSDGTCIDESQLEYIEESIDGLDEAAKEYEKRVIEETKCHHNALTYAEGYENALLLIPDAFISGAKWQKEKDQETIKLAEDHAFLAGADWQKEHNPLPEDTVLFNKGIEEGKILALTELSEKFSNAYQLGLEDKEKQMIEKAVEGQIYGCDGSHWIETDINENIKGKYGDKVHVIVIKDNNPKFE